MHEPCCAAQALLDHTQLLPTLTYWRSVAAVVSKQHALPAWVSETRTLSWHWESSVCTNGIKAVMYCRPTMHACNNISYISQKCICPIHQNVFTRLNSCVMQSMVTLQIWLHGFRCKSLSTSAMDWSSLLHSAMQQAYLLVV